MQTKKDSFIEATTNTTIGFVISMVTAPIVNWICGIEANTLQVTGSVILFTLISIARGYIVRRWFNKKEDGKN